MFNKHYDSVDRDDKRLFIALRTRYNAPKQHGDLRGKHVYTTFIEKPEIMAQRMLDIKLGRTTMIRNPLPHEIIPCCGPYFRFITGGNNDTLYQQAMRREKEGPLIAEDLDLHQPLPPRKPHGKRKDNNTTEHAIVCWLLDVAKNALHLPNDDSGDDIVILPWWSKYAAHAAFVQEQEFISKVAWCDDFVEVARHRGKKSLRSAFRYGNPLLGLKGTLPEKPGLASYGYFCRVWKEQPETRFIQLRKWMPFAKCTQCVAYRKTLGRGKRSSTMEKSKARDDHREHLVEIKLERRHYYSNRMRAVLEPKTYVSVIVDGADQSKHNVPHDPDASHLLEETVRQQLFAYGALSHGRKAYTFLLPGHVKQGHDVTIEVIWRIINDIKETEGQLPPILLIQLDNTSKQNKGRYLFAFLALLVHHGVFDKILISFLPVGHTHEDIDQMFSRFATYLRKRSAYSRQEMRDALERAMMYNDKPVDVQILDTVAGMSEFLESGTGIALPECMSKRHFKITVDKDNAVILQARNSPVVSHKDDPWRGLEEQTLFHSMFPHKVPNLLNAIKVCVLFPFLFFMVCFYVFFFSRPTPCRLRLCQRHNSTPKR